MSRTGLGRGLGALLGPAPVVVAAPSTAGAPAPGEPASASPNDPRVLQISLGRVMPCPTQPRKDFDRAALEELAASVREQGIVQPLLVRPAGSDFELIAGERRWRAAQMAGLKTVPVIVREASNAQMLELALVENLQREDLNAIEQAQGFGLLIEAFSLTQEQAALRVGKSREAVANALRLLKLDDEVQALVRSGQLSVGHAKVILTLPAGEPQRRAAREVMEQSLSVRRTEALIERLRKTAVGVAPGLVPVPAPAATAVHVRALEQRLQEALGTQVSLSYRRGKGSVNIRFYSDEDLERLLLRLGVAAE